MSKWSLENQLTLYCGAVSLLAVVAISLWSGLTLLAWQGFAAVLAIAAFATAVFRFLIARSMRRMNDVVAVAERLAHSDASARIEWVRPAGGESRDAELVARVDQLSQAFQGSFHGEFRLDEEDACTSAS